MALALFFCVGVGASDEGAEDGKKESRENVLELLNLARLEFSQGEMREENCVCPT